MTRSISTTITTVVLTKEQRAALFAYDTSLDREFNEWLQYDRTNAISMSGLYQQFLTEVYRVQLQYVGDHVQLIGEPEDITYLLLNL